MVLGSFVTFLYKIARLANDISYLKKPHKIGQRIINKKIIGGFSGRIRFGKGSMFDKK